MTARFVLALGLAVPCLPTVAHASMAEGNRKMLSLQAQRSASLRLAPMAGRGGGGLMFGGRF